MIRESVIACIPSAWDENHITYKIIETLKGKLNPDFVINSRNNTNVLWHPYKAKGKVETDFGDIAILVNIIYDDGKTLTGIGFLEAKRRNVHSKKFIQIKRRQLGRILKNAHYSRLLLYDYKDITQFADTSIFDRIPGSLHHSPFVPVTRSAVVPVSIALPKRITNISLYDFSLPFSYQLCFRYPNGLDLELSETSIGVVKGAIKKEYDSMEIPIAPKYIVAFSVSNGNRYPSLEYLPINRDLYVSA
ncbi:hypothetical protein [Candidatus Nitrososphaera evergladensis]|uniref:hypothetical protein n=1 Tax=Candidatus Nitrososphaera evergladensis TaxID=1459637 RepID=UPI0011E5AB47|nr:hypothetical protein [Candidatus Nitrososphaera evergladensis]